MYFLAYVSDSMLTLVSCIPVFLSGRFHSGKLQAALSFHNSDMHEFQLSYFKDFSFVFSFHIFYHDVSSCGFLSCIIIPVLQQHALNLSYHDILTRSNCKKKKSTNFAIHLSVHRSSSVTNHVIPLNICHNWSLLFYFFSSRPDNKAYSCAVPLSSSDI